MTRDEIIKKLAAIDIREMNVRGGERLALIELILAARKFEQSPKLTAIDEGAGPASKDYLAVLQLAICVGHDGQLKVIRRLDSPDAVLVPILAAHKHITTLLHREAFRQVGLSSEALEDAVGKLAEELVDIDFREAFKLPGKDRDES